MTPGTLISGAMVFVGAPYLPNLEKACAAMQDTDTALLGVVSPARPGGGISTARQLVREAVKRTHQFITAGRPR